MDTDTQQRLIGQFNTNDVLDAVNELDHVCSLINNKEHPALECVRSGLLELYEIVHPIIDGGETHTDADDCWQLASDTEWILSNLIEHVDSIAAVLRYFLSLASTTKTGEAIPCESLAQ